MHHNIYGHALAPGVLAALVWMFGGVARAAAGTGVESDHTLWLTVETAPAGATVLAVPEEGDTEEKVLGQTPCTLAVDLNWRSGPFWKHWNLLRVSSPCGFCQPFLQPGKEYRLMARLLIRKEGWQPVRVDAPIAVLTNPGRGWRGREQWPKKQTLSYTLEPSAAVTELPALSATSLRRVVLAGGEEGSGKVETGRIMVFSKAAGAEVFVDDQPVGPAPVELLLQAGLHVIEVRAGPLPVSRREINLAPESSIAFEASFPP